MFRDIKQLAHVYQVYWITDVCHRFFMRSIASTDDVDVHGMLFLFEESRYILEHQAQKGYMELVLNKIGRRHEMLETFVRNYCMQFNFISLTTSQLDLMATITAKTPEILVKIVIENIECNELMFHRNCRYLLQNLDLVRCLDQNRALYNSLFDLLLEKVVDLSIEDLKLIVRLNRSSVDTYMTRFGSHFTQTNRYSSSSCSSDSSFKLPSISSQSPVSQSSDSSSTVLFGSDITGISDLSRRTSDLPVLVKSIRPSLSSGSESRPGTAPELPNIGKIGKSIPNLFVSVDELRLCKGSDVIDTLTTSPDVNSLFMLFEALPHFKSIHTNASKAIQQLKTIKDNRNWPRVVPSFLEPLCRYPHTNLIQRIKETPSLASANDTIQIISSTPTILSKMVLEEGLHKFYFKHPDTTRSPCNQPGRCGFLLKVTPATKTNPGNFDIKLSTLPEDYTGDIHLHKEVSPDNMHLVIREYDQLHRRKWYNRVVSWFGRPSVRDGGVVWGKISQFKKIKMVIYYDIVRL